MKTKYVLLMILSFNQISISQSQITINKFCDSVQHVVQHYYPNAMFTRTDTTLCFEFNTRDFYIHNVTKTGVWQDAIKERGPNKGGIYGEISLRVGDLPPNAAERILGKSGWPTFERYYFVEGVIEEVSKVRRCYLVFVLRFPGDLSEQFLNELRNLSNHFEEFI